MFKIPIIILKKFLPSKFKNYIKSNLILKFYSLQIDIFYFSKSILILFVKKKSFKELANKLSRKEIEQLIFISQINYYIDNFSRNYSKLKINKIFNLFKYDLVLNNIEFFFKIWLGSIKKDYPYTAISILKSFYNLQDSDDIFKYNKINIGNKDLYLSHYIFYFFFLYKLTHLNLLKKNIFDFINYFNIYFKDPEFIRYTECFSETCLCDYSYYKKINELNSKKTKGLTAFYGASAYAFGHMCTLVDFLHRVKKKNFIISLHSNYVANQFLAKYLELKYSFRINFNNKQFVKNLIKGNFYHLELYHSFIEKKNPTCFNVTYQEYKKLRKINPSIDRKILINIKKNSIFKELNFNSKYICYFSRYKEFKNEDYKQVKLNADRYSDIDQALPAIKYFIKMGYRIVVMGGPLQKKLNLQNSNIFDYAHSHYKNDYNDILLPMNSSFIMHNGESGTSMLNTLFSKYSFNIEYPFNRKPIFDPNAFYLLRPLYYKNKKISPEDFFNEELFTCYDFKQLETKGYKYKNNKKKTILKSAKIFLDIYEKNKINKTFIKSIKNPKINFNYNIITNYNS